MTTMKEKVMGSPRSYRSMEEFEREEIRPHQKCGWSIDDLFQDAELKNRGADYAEDEPAELDFGF